MAKGKTDRPAGGGKQGAAFVESLRKKGAERVRIGGFDIDGVLRGKYVSFEKLASLIDSGFGFCDVIFGWDSSDVLYDNTKATGWHTGYPDTLAQADVSTLRSVPWEPGTVFILADFYSAPGKPLPICPRQVLKRVLSMAEERGYSPKFSCEYEFFFFQETPASVREKGYRALTPLSPGMFGYSILRASRSSALVQDILGHLKAFDLEVEGLHTETGPGVFEAAIAYDEALRSADKAALFKTAVKEIAAKHGLMAAFMAKWNENLPGCSGHIHQSLWDAKGSRNLFEARGEGEPVLNELFRHYLGGLRATLPEFLALYAPTINSYKRFVPGTWAPTAAHWGHENRTAALRVITGPSAKAARIECRVTAADINPYLAFAANLAAGLHGIESRIEPGDPLHGNAYEQPETSATSFPRTLKEAVVRLRKSDPAARYLGKEFLDHYCATRDWEVRCFEKAVTNWELER
ncbi:MAG: glutamine synthetase family protein, partial [Bdellovibrionota bacterium]